MTSGQLLTKIGRLLFGERWKSDVAHAINAEAERNGETRRVTPDRIDDWSKDRGSLPPAGVWLALAGLLQDREASMAELPRLKVAVIDLAQQWNDAFDRREAAVKRYSAGVTASVSDVLSLKREMDEAQAAFVAIGKEVGRRHS
jgi:hypothetical protein